MTRTISLRANKYINLSRGQTTESWAMVTANKLFESAFRLNVPGIDRDLLGRMALPINANRSLRQARHTTTHDCTAEQWNASVVKGRVWPRRP